MSRNGPRLDRLMRKSRRCFWCETPVRRVTPAPGEAMPDDAATVDHLRQRGDPNRGADSIEATVLACHRCNSDRERANSRGMTLAHYRAALSEATHLQAETLGDGF